MRYLRIFSWVGPIFFTILKNNVDEGNRTQFADDIKLGGLLIPQKIGLMFKRHLIHLNIGLQSTKCSSIINIRFCT